MPLLHTAHTTSTSLPLSHTAHTTSSISGGNGERVRLATVAVDRRKEQAGHGGDRLGRVAVHISTDNKDGNTETRGGGDAAQHVCLAMLPSPSRLPRPTHSALQHVRLAMLPSALSALPMSPSPCHPPARAPCLSRPPFSLPPPISLLRHPHRCPTAACPVTVLSHAEAEARGV